MAKVLIHDENLTNIANAIREKNGETTTYLPSEMATAIQNISGGGPTITKGIVINEYDRYGYPIDVSVVGLTEIEDYMFSHAFYYDGALNYYGYGLLGKCQKFSIPEDLTRIGEYSFQYCDMFPLTSLPDTIINIEKGAFEYCTELHLSKLPKNLTKINDNTFCTCTELALKSLPDGITSIGTYSFYNCPNLALESLPDSLTSIGDHAFYNCEKITIKSIPSKVTIIDSYVFQKCESITEMTCLGNITTINNTAFRDCKLSKFMLPNITSVPKLTHTNAFSGTPIESGTGYIYVPDTLVDSFKSASNWSIYAEQIRPISSLNNILDLSQQQFPITTDGNMTVDYDAASQTFTLNGTIEESHGFNIPITQELLGTYTLSYNHTETDKAFYISIDNKTETMLNGWGANTKTFTLTEQPSQLMFWFDHSDSTPERNVYTDYKINLVLMEGENE